MPSEKPHRCGLSVIPIVPGAMIWTAPGRQCAPAGQHAPLGRMTMLVILVRL